MPRARQLTSSGPAVCQRIPALGGRTPREAPLDPAGRREVLALLDDMAWSRRQAGGIARNESMDPDRIRTLLGLPAHPDPRLFEAIGVIASFARSIDRVATIRREEPG